MTLNTQYWMCRRWVIALTFLAAFDAGVSVRSMHGLLASLAENWIAVSVLGLHITAYFAVRSARPWGWVFASLWLPVWVGYYTWDLYQTGEPLLTALWAPFLFGTGLVHGFLVRDEVREAYGMRHRVWGGLRLLVPVELCGVGLGCVGALFGYGIGALLVLSLFLIVKTRRKVYGEGVWW
jgi:hypothetical protein